VFSLEKIVKGTLFKIKFKLQQSIFEISSWVKSLQAITNLEDESTEPQRAFYLFSLMLLMFLIFLSPDKIAQVFSFTQGDVGIWERPQEITKIIKKLLPLF